MAPMKHIAVGQHATMRQKPSAGAAVVRLSPGVAQPATPVHALAQQQQQQQQQSPAPQQLRLLSGVATLCEIQGLTTKYEMLAGRSAMLGTISALAVETLTGTSLFTSINVELAQLALGTCLLAGLLAAGLGTNDSRLPPALLEPVVSSLTAVKRSQSSITPSHNVDRLVDDVVRSTFTQERMRELTDYTSEV